MAAWSQNVSLTPPPGLAPLVSGLGTLASAAGTTLDASQAALNAAKVFLQGTVSPQAATASALITQARAITNDLFRAGLYQVFVHPWMPGVGHGAGVFRNLSFPNAVKAIAASFDDARDHERPRFSSAAPVEMICLIAGAPSPAIFAQVLAALATLTGSREFRLAERRLKQAFAQEKERFILPQGSRLPDWQSVTVTEMFPALAPLQQALNASLALLEGYASGSQKAVDIAISLIAAKKAQLAALQTKLDAAATLFGQGLNGAGVYALHVSGTGGNALLKNELKSAAGAPGPELSFCAGVAWVGPEGSLTGLKNLFAA